MRVDWQHRYSRFRVIHLLAICLSFTVILNIKNAAMIVVCRWQDQPPVKLSVNDPRPAPKGGTLEISYFVSPVTGKPENPRELLQMLLNARAASDNPGRFELKQTGQVFHAIPEQVKDVRGRWVHQASICTCFM
jgi:hypothetical protein